MAAMQGCDIQAVVQILRERGAYLYHACQLQDFRSYLKLGGVPSRQVLEGSRLPYTMFDTDGSDHGVGVWDKVFLNLQDFGVSYARFGGEEGTAATPNPYGPVLLVFEPEILLEGDDLSITLRSAGAEGFDRNRECLSNPSHVHHLFKHVDPDEAPNDFARTYIAFAADLQQRFKWDGARSVEINCHVQNGLFRFDRLSKVLVDEYSFVEGSLTNLVNESLNDVGRIAQVRERNYINSVRVKQINELAELLVHQDLTLDCLVNMPDLPEALAAWVVRLHQRGVGFNFNRYARYLRHGTLLEV